MRKAKRGGYTTMWSDCSAPGPFYGCLRYPGKDFRQVLTDNVSKCTVLLAIIGPNWTSVTDAWGARRLVPFIALVICPASASQNPERSVELQVPRLRS